MIFTPFFKDFPKIATKWAKYAVLRSGQEVHSYTFVPSFCMDKKCDCRRAMMNVYKDNNLAHQEAVISYGWEEKEFYKKEFGFLSKKELTNFIGPALDPYQPQGRDAKMLLNLFIELLEEPLYITHIKMQYAMVKHKQKMKRLKGIRFNSMMDCPCESGSAFRICRGR